jgi:hypothetical protein
MKLERRTVWSTLKFRRRSLRYVSGEDVSSVTEGINKCNRNIEGNSATMLSLVIQGHSCINVIRRHCLIKQSDEIRDTPTYSYMDGLVN